MGDALALIAVLGIGLAIWQWSVAGRERVFAISARICRDLDVQRLDDSVTLRRLRLRREVGLVIERRYEFEFSTDGVDRHRGEIALVGRGSTWARLEHPQGPVLIDLTTRRIS